MGQGTWISFDNQKELAEVLCNNTHLENLNLNSCGIATNAAVYFAEALKRNQSLKKLDLGKNKIATEGVKQIAEALAYNHSLTELILLGGPVIGESALTAFIDSFDYNTTLLNIKWRLNSRQSFKINSSLTRNKEIARRRRLGKSIADIDPNSRRETEAKLNQERGGDSTIRQETPAAA